MLNQMVLIGKISKLIEEKDENNKPIINKFIVENWNIDAENDSDRNFIEINTLKSLPTNSINLFKVGELVGIKGRVVGVGDQDNHSIKITAERITLLSPRTKENVEQER